MEQCQFTILIPTVNRLPLLKRALESALGQSVPARVYVSDNGSEDGTAAYLASLQHAMLEKRRNETTIPIHAHFEQFFYEINTTWCVFLSDDDYLESTFIESLTRAIEKYPSARMLYSHARIHMWETEYEGQGGPGVEEGWRFLYAFLNGQRDPCFCAMAFRTADMHEMGLTPTDRMIGDMYRWVRVAALGPVACVPEPLSHYTFIRDATDNQTSGISVRNWLKESQLLAKEMTEVIQSSGGVEAPSDGVLAATCDRFLARTCSNHIIWNAVRGRPRLKIWRDVLDAGSCFLKYPSVWPRVLGGALCSRGLIKTMLSAYVRKVLGPPRKGHPSDE